jgi:hypothetical protein
MNRVSEGYIFPHAMTLSFKKLDMPAVGAVKALPSISTVIAIEV